MVLRGVLFSLLAYGLCFVDTSQAIELKTALSLDEAVAAALAWHPRIATAKARLEEQEQRQRMAKAAYYPQVSAGAKGGFEGRGSEQKYSQTITLSLSQMLYDFGKVRTEVAAEQALVVKHQAELLKSIEDIIYDTSTAVYEVWRNQLLENMAKQQHEALKELSDLVSERHHKGAATRSDLAQSQTRVEGAFTQLLQYRNQKLLWQNRLASLLAQQQALAVGSEPKELAKSYCEFSEASLDLAPSLMVAYALRDNAEATANKAHARTWPTISLDPSISHHTKRAHWSNNDAPERTEYGVFINVNMPLYQGGALSAERKMARARQMAAESEIYTEKQRILEALFTSLSQRQVFEHHSKVLIEREKLSLETRRLYQQQYLELGARPLIDLLNAEQEIYQTRFEKINIHTDMQLMSLICAHELGQLHQMMGLAEAEIQGVQLSP